jgi:hypothetical protein
VRDHVSGQLKVAPEHCSDGVLDAMGKPHFAVYEKFRRRFFELTKSMGKEQYLVPYLMSSHPGSTLADAVTLAECLKRDHYAPEQVQDYYPTPGTASTVMFYTGINPLTMKPVFVPRDYHEKQMQRALLQFNRPQNADAVREALKRAHREDLIGTAPHSLVRPATRKAQAKEYQNEGKRGEKSSNSMEKGRKSSTRQARAQAPKQGKKQMKKGDSVRGKAVAKRKNSR